MPAGSGGCASGDSVAVDWIVAWSGVELCDVGRDDGALIIGEKLMWGKALELWPAVLRHVYVVIAVLLSFVVLVRTGWVAR